MPIVFLKDTFSGTAGTNLTGRTPDVGSAWTQSFSSPAGGDLELDGSGNLCTKATVANQSIWDINPAQSTSGDMDVSFSAVLRPGTADNFGVGAQLPATFDGYYLSFDGGTTPTVYNIASNTAIWTGSALAAGSHAVVLSYRAAGTFAVKVDGTTLTTLTGLLTTCKIVAVRNFAPTSPLGPGVGTSISNLVATDPSTSPPSTTFAPDDPGIVYSPATWSVSHTAAITNSPDGYAGTTVTVPAGGAGNVTLDVDTTAYTHTTSLRYSIDGGGWQVASLAAGTTSVPLATGLAAGAHSVRWYQGWMDYNGDGWGSGTGPLDALKVTGLVCDAGATLAAPTARAGTLVVLSDSVAGGIRLASNADDATNSDGGSAWPAFAAEALDCEVGNVGISGQGWTVAGGMHFPALFVPGSDATSAWDKLWSGAARTFPSGCTILIQQGNNDQTNGATDAAVTSAVSGFLPALRAAAPSSKIIVAACFSGYKTTAIKAGWDSYAGTSTAVPGAPSRWTVLKAVSDANCYYVDFGADGLTLIPAAHVPAEFTTDGAHPNVRGTAAAAALVARAIQLIDSPTGGGGSAVFAPIGSSIIRGV